MIPLPSAAGFFVICGMELQTEAAIKDSFSIKHWNSHTFRKTDVCRIIYHKIFLIEEGQGTLQIDGITYPVSGNELFLLAKGQLYSFGTDTIISGYELSFGDCFWEKAPASASNCKAVLFNDVSVNQHIPVENNEPGTLFKMLHEEFLKETYINKPDALAAYLKIIMIKIANINAALIKAYDSYENRIYREFIALLNKHYQDIHEVSAFAAKLSISARKLADICKACSGKGAKDIINEHIITEAKRSLQFSSLPVKEIAFELNFSTPEQFSHFFKKNTGTAPYEYRAQFVKIGM